jgi:hypothetical protein
MLSRGAPLTGVLVDREKFVGLPIVEHHDHNGRSASARTSPADRRADPRSRPRCARSRLGARTTPAGSEAVAALPRWECVRPLAGEPRYRRGPSQNLVEVDPRATAR